MRLRLMGWAMTVMSAALAVLTWPNVASNLATAAGSDFPAAAAACRDLAMAAVAAYVLVVVAMGVSQGSVPAPRTMRAVLFIGVVVAPTAAHADGSHDLDGLRLPDRPEIVHVVPATEASVTVVPGDTLWKLASDELGGSATNADIVAAVQAWHATNRSVIGHDPDLIRPGQVLTPPDHQEEK